MTDELTGSEDPRLAEALEYANTLIRLSPDGVLAVDLDLRITEWNLLMEQMCGKTRQQEIGQDLAEIPFMKETGEGARIREGLGGKSIGPREVAYRIPGEDTDRLFESVMAPLRGPAGDVLGAVVRVRDITDSKQADRAIKQSEKEYRQLFEDSRDALMVMRPPSWRFTDANPAMLHMFGAASTAEFAALGPWDVSPERQPDGRLSAEKAREMIATALREGSHEFEWESRRVSGELFTSDVLLARMEADGQFFVKGTVRDISERKRAEEHVLTLNRALEEKVQQLLAAQEELEQQRAHLEQEVARRTASLTEAQRIAHLGNWKWDMATNTVNWSDEMYSILGYAPQQIGASYETFLNAVHPEDRQAVDDSVRDALERRHAYSIEHRILRPDGTLRDVHGQAEVLRGEDGQSISMLGTLHDITDRKRADQVASDERAFSQTLIASQPGIFYVLDAVGRFIRWNDKLRAVLGYSDSQLAEANALDIVYEADRPLVAQKTRDTFEWGTATNVARIITKTGIRHFSLTATRVNTAKGAYAVGVGTDITARMQMETELRESELAYRTLSQNLPGMVYRVFIREGGRMQVYGDRSVQVTGYAEDELTTGEVCSIEPLILEEDRPGVRAEVARAIAGARAFVVEYRLTHKDGGIRWVQEHGMPVYGADGGPLHIDGVIFDITAHKHDVLELRLFRALLDNSRDGIEVIDPATMRFLDVNETECRELGYSREELLTMSVKDIETEFTERQVLEFRAQILETGEGRFDSTHRRKDDTTYPVEVRAKMVDFGKPYMLSIVRDITERRRAEAEVQTLQEQLREQALRDPLTGLYNRRYLDETIARELGRAARNNQPVGIVMCDLDHFKRVNDEHGHVCGDEVLRVFADLLTRHTRGSDIVCRFGGEEFVVCLPDMSPADAYRRAEQVRAELGAKRIVLGAAVVQITASFGVATFPENGKTMDSLIRAVDAAMYQAKEAGRDRVVVSSVRAADGQRAREEVGR